MTGNRNDDREALDRLTAAMVDDLLNASEQELISEILEEGGNPTQDAEAMRAVIEQAARLCGKSRLRAAKNAIASTPNSKAQNVARLDIVEARRKLASILARESFENDFSVAARNESGLSDDDVLGMLADLEELGVLPGTAREPGS